MSDDALPRRQHAPRSKISNIHVTDILTYRLPPAGLVSIAHRISGALMFLLLPFIVWMFDTSLTTEQSYERFTALFLAGALGLPGWFFKLVALALIWALLQHSLAGVRHLWMDATHSVGLRFGRVSALVVLGLTAVLTLLLGAKLFFF